MTMNLVIRMRTPGGIKLGLADVLASVPSNDWSWVILEFEGYTHESSSCDVQALADTALNHPGGVATTWREMVQLADELTDLNWLVAVAAASEVPGDQLLRAEQYSGCSLVLSAFDGSEWEFTAPDDNPEGVAVLQSLRLRFGAS
ncbi:hypothetical protein [Subtercola sp. YIM 133946]|uniref:hypothetical protein n=1 Tax=Subtercola sp. YIM 133946 TaxID=3118909 RepID=UPI002F95C018